jgi:hypothetical protein
MSKRLTSHNVNGNSHQTVIRPVEESKTAGGAPSQYKVYGAEEKYAIQTIDFQDCSVEEFGVVGVTNGVLIAIVMDRLESFQQGATPCDENKDALANLKDALFFLQSRTKDRIRRQVIDTQEA